MKLNHINPKYGQRNFGGIQDFKNNLNNLNN